MAATELVRCWQVGRPANQRLLLPDYRTIELFILKMVENVVGRETRQQKPIKCYYRGSSGQMAKGKQ